MGFKNRPFVKPSDTRLDTVDYDHENVGPITVATTSNSDLLWIAPRDLRLTKIQVVGGATLTADDTNYVTWTVTNLGTAGSGSTALLSTADTNTTKATGGSTLTLLVPRTLVLTSTDASLKVKEGELIRIRAAATGTLANTVTLYEALLKFSDNLIK